MYCYFTVTCRSLHYHTILYLHPVVQLLKEAFQKHPDLWGPSKVRHTVVASWYQRPGYLRAMAGLLVQRMARFSEAEMAEGLHVLFSAHGVPESYIRGQYY